MHMISDAQWSGPHNTHTACLAPTLMLARSKASNDVALKMYTTKCWNSSLGLQKFRIEVRAAYILGMVLIGIGHCHSGLVGSLPWLLFWRFGFDSWHSVMYVYFKIFDCHCSFSYVALHHGLMETDAWKLKKGLQNCFNHCITNSLHFRLFAYWLKYKYIGIKLFENIS